MSSQPAAKSAAAATTLATSFVLPPTRAPSASSARPSRLVTEEGLARRILASPIPWSRCFESRSRQRRSRWRIPLGVSAGSRDQSMLSRTTAAMTSVTFSPWKSARPVTISKRTTPNDQMSARLSTGLPRACSGAM